MGNWVSLTLLIGVIIHSIDNDRLKGPTLFAFSKKTEISHKETWIWISSSNGGSFWKISHTWDERYIIATWKVDFYGKCGWMCNRPMDAMVVPEQN